MCLIFGSICIEIERAYIRSPRLFHSAQLFLAPLARSARPLDQTDTPSTQNVHSVTVCAVYRRRSSRRTMHFGSRKSMHKRNSEYLIENI